MKSIYIVVVPAENRELTFNFISERTLFLCITVSVFGSAVVSQGKSFQIWVMLLLCLNKRHATETWSRDVAPYIINFCTT